MEKVTVIYIIAISLQLAGAVILIINYCRNTHNQIIDRYFPGSNLVERDNKDNIVLEKERVQEVVREIFMNRCAFFYIGAGYIVGIYGEAGKTNKCIISILVIIGSFLLIKPVPGKERLYTILGEDGIYNEKKLAEFQQKHSVVTTIILNIPRLPEEGVLNAEKK